MWGPRGGGGGGAGYAVCSADCCFVLCSPIHLSGCTDQTLREPETQQPSSVSHRLRSSGSAS